MATFVVGLTTLGSRAELVTFIGARGAVDGAIYSDGTVEYIGVSGSTVISDLAGLEPYGDVYPEHFGTVGAGSDDSAVLQAALDYLEDLELSASVEGGQGGVLNLRNKSYLIRTMLQVSQRVGIVGQHRQESVLYQDDSSYGPVIFCKADVATSSPQNSPQTRLENFCIDGNNSNHFTTTGATTSGSPDVVVASAAEVAVGQLFEANGFPIGTKVQSIAGTTITMDTNATVSVPSRTIGFRTALALSGTTTSGSATLTVASTTTLKVGMLISGTGVRADTIIKSIDSATAVTMSKTATASGTATMTFSAYNYGVYAEQGEPVRYNQGPLLTNIWIRQASGDAVHICPERTQTTLEKVSGNFGKGSGFVLNSSSDCSANECDFGSTWRYCVLVSTSATMRFHSCEAFQTHLNDKYQEVRSFQNLAFTWAYGEINGVARVDATDSDPHNIIFEGANFYFTAANLDPATGTRDEYVYNDGVDGLKLSNCQFAASSGGDRPNYILTKNGSTKTWLASPIDPASYATGIASGLANIVFPYGHSSTFTATVEDSSGNVSATTVTGHYHLHGEMVTVSVNGLSNIDKTGLTGTDQLKIILPFSMPGSLENHYGHVRVQSGTGITADYLLLLAIPGTNEATIRLINFNGAETVMLVNNLQTSATDISYTITYPRVA